jgi:hypothetical protein
MATSTMAREETTVRDLFTRVDEVLDVAHTIEGERPQEAARLVHVSHDALSSAGPVRVPIAARILLSAIRPSAPGWKRAFLPRGRCGLACFSTRRGSIRSYASSATCGRLGRIGTFGKVSGTGCRMRRCWTGRTWLKAFLT